MSIDKQAGGVAAVDRALSILDAFTEADHSLSLAELARRTGLYKSTILRLITSMQRSGYMSRLDGGEYSLGPALLRLGELYQASFNLEEIVLPSLRQLVHETGESAAYYVRDGDERVCLYRVASTTHRVLHYVTPGTRFALETGASGCVLRAFAAPASADADCEEARRNLVAVSAQDRRAETVALAAPVFDARSKGSAAGSLSLAGPATRFTPEALSSMKTAVRDEARRLTEALGGRWPAIAD